MRFKGIRHSYRTRGVQGKSPDPTEDQIKARCEQIQLTWSEQEARLRQNSRVVPSERYGMTLRRGTVADLEEYTVPMVSVREMEEAA